jgi:putative intracellular protease/amidase
VVRHGRIITANGPKAATRFGQHLAAALAEEDKP